MSINPYINNEQITAQIFPNLIAMKAKWCGMPDVTPTGLKNGPTNGGVVSTRLSSKFLSKEWTLRRSQPGKTWLEMCYLLVIFGALFGGF